MGHELVPRSGSLPPVAEVARLIASEFPHTLIDAEGGLARAHELAAWIERASPKIFLGQHEVALKNVQAMKSLKLGEALLIEFGDSPDLTLHVAVIPGNALNFGYRSKEEELNARGLLERCARVLDCEIVVF